MRTLEFITGHVTFKLRSFFRVMRFSNLQKKIQTFCVHLETSHIKQKKASNPKIQVKLK